MLTSLPADWSNCFHFPVLWGSWNFCSANIPTSNSMPCFTKLLLVYVILVFLQKINTAAIKILFGVLSLCIFYLSGILPTPNWASSAAPTQIFNFSVQWDPQNVPILGLYATALQSTVFCDPGPASIQGEILGSHEGYPFS